MLLVSQLPVNSWFKADGLEFFGQACYFMTINMSEITCWRCQVVFQTSLASRSPVCENSLRFRPV